MVPLLLLECDNATKAIGKLLSDKHHVTKLDFCPGGLTIGLVRNSWCGKPPKVLVLKAFGITNFYKKD